jgi:NADH:ubiquinone oxidoreductase subunit 6 (subunit J)
MLLAAIGAAAVVFGVLAIRAPRLILASVWLAAVSACTAGLLYAVGAQEVAVIELSVGVGLVTVLLVFAITMAGDPAAEAQPILPTPLAWMLALTSLVLLGSLWLPLPRVSGGAVLPLAQALWQQRGLDVVAQVVLIFAGVLGVLGLLSEPKRPLVPQAGRDARARELEETRR